MPLVELELACFPCGPDKRPLIAGGFKSAVTGRDRIEDLFRRYPGALVGAPTGAVSGFDVLDIDRGGEDWLALYEATHGLPATRIVGTRSGGLHLYFEHRVGMKCSAGLLAQNVDVRSTGGYVILWNLAGCRVLSDAAVAPWPGPMLELLHEATEARRRPAPSLYGTHVSSSLNGTHVSSYEIPKPLYFKMCRLMPGSTPHYRRRVRGLLKVLVEKRENRNHALNTIGFAFRELIATGVIECSAVESLLIDAATLNGWIAKDGLGAALATINSSLGPVEHMGPIKG
jgi:hypothetical protein